MNNDIHCVTYMFGKLKFVAYLPFKYSFLKQIYYGFRYKVI
jgi:hypothetical protein